MNYHRVGCRPGHPAASCRDTIQQRARERAERCWSGRTGLPAKQLHRLKPVSGVRIPPSPPSAPPGPDGAERHRAHLPFQITCANAVAVEAFLEFRGEGVAGGGEIIDVFVEVYAGEAGGLDDREVVAALRGAGNAADVGEK